MTKRHKGARRVPQRSGLRLSVSERARLARIEALNEVVELTVSALEPREAARRALDFVVEHLNISAAAAWRRNDGELELIAAVDFPQAYVDATKTLPLTAPLDNVKVAVTGEPIAAGDLAQFNPAAQKRFAAMGATVGAYALVPIIAKGETIGVLGFTWPEPRTFSNEDVDFYMALAGQLGLALENARVFEAERLRAARMEVLRDVAELVASSLDPDQVIAVALASAVEHIGVLAASVWLVDSSGVLHLAGARGFPVLFFQDFANGIPRDADYDAARAVRSDRPVVHEDAATSDVSAPVAEAYRRYGIKLGALIVLPLRVGTKVIGALTLAWDTARNFDAEAIAFDVSFANAFSTALSNARLFEDIRDQGERIAEIVNSMDDAFVSVDREWRYTLVNAKAAAMLGKSAVYLIGRRMDQEFPDVAGWPYYREAMEQRVPVSFESYAEMADAWVEVHAYPTLDGISMYVSDITERKAAERELERVRILLDAHIGNSPLAVLEFDREFTITRWSDGAERMFGWTAEEVLGTVLTDLPWIYEEDAELVARATEDLFTGATPRSRNTNRNYRKDGSLIWCEWYSSAIYDDQGLVSVFAQVLDITDKRRAEEAVRSALAEAAEERTRLRQIINEIPIGVAVIGPDGDVLEVNEATNHIWAGSVPRSNDASGGLVYEGRRHDTGEPVKLAEWPGLRAIESGLANSSLIDFDRLDGTTGVAQVSALPIHDDTGELTRVVVITQNVTEQVDTQRLAASLNEISLEVGSTLDAHEILERLTCYGREALRTQAAAAVVRRGRHWALVSGAGLPDGLIDRPLRDVDAEAMREIFRQTEPIAAADAQLDPRVMGGKLAELGVKSVIALPLITHSDMPGALFFWHTAHRRDFSEPQIEFARKLMTIASLALDNAHLYEREHHIAETLQQAILTPPEPVAGVAISYVYQPASAAAHVGGDFYEVAAVTEDRVAFMVGDVSGKGIEAARFTSLLKDGARAFLLEGDGPQRVLERLNLLAWRSTPIERFATAFTATLEISTGALSYAGAGHPPAIVCGENGARTLESCSGLLGAWEKVDIAGSTCELAVGDVIVMYTDGVTEARREGEFFGEHRVVDAVRRLHGTMSVSDLPQALLDDVLEYSGGKLRDDVIILCVAREPRAE